MSFPERKSPRKRDFDYAMPGYYFVTICAKEKKCIFSRITANNQQKSYKLDLSEYGEIINQNIISLPIRFPQMEIVKYVIMPNHLHILLALHKETSVSLSDIVGAFKSLASNECRERGLNGIIFQKPFHDHIIRGQRDFENIWNYIHVNPNRWHEDCFFESEEEE